MMKKYLSVNMLIMLGFLSALLAMAAMLVLHHHDIPAEIETHRRNLIGSGMTTADRIAPVAKIAMAGSAKVSADLAQASAIVQVKERDGQQVYQASCVACHGAGIAGAPKVGDKAQWIARVSAGTDALYRHALLGLQGAAGVMPAKGGNPSLSDQEVKAAVDFMVAQLQ
jgi:cytochrome c5